VDERPFPPAEPMRFPDESERAAAAWKNVQRRRKTRAAGAAGAAAVLAAAATVALLLAGNGSPPRRADISVAGGPSSTVSAPKPVTAVTPATVTPTTVTPASSPATPAHSTPTTTPSPVPTTSPKSTTTVAPVTTTTVAPAGTLNGARGVTGIVTDSSGKPIPNAYVIGMSDLSVARTDANGHYSMRCTGQKLVAATWLLPVDQAGATSVTFGVNSTQYGPPPTTAGAGYVFSGGATDVGQATPAPCDGQPVNFRLPIGATVDIGWVTGSGNPSGPGPTPTTTSLPSIPIDNLYLPGLDDQGALETAPISPTGHQVIGQLGPGTLRIDGTMTSFTCSGPGVAGSGAIWTVTVATGATTSVTCTTN
jgi:hypothetical protein